MWRVFLNGFLCPKGPSSPVSPLKPTVAPAPVNTWGVHSLMETAAQRTASRPSEQPPSATPAGAGGLNTFAAEEQ